MTDPTAILLGALAGVGLLTLALGFRRKRPQEETFRLRKFRAKGMRADVRKAVAERMLQLVLAALLGLGSW